MLGEARRDGVWDLALSDGSAELIAQRLSGLSGVTVCRHVTAGS